MVWPRARQSPAYAPPFAAGIDAVGAGAALKITIALRIATALAVAAAAANPSTAVAIVVVIAVIIAFITSFHNDYCRPAVLVELPVDAGSTLSLYRNNTII